jgi:hypothetical protein
LALFYPLLRWQMNGESCSENSEFSGQRRTSFFVCAAGRIFFSDCHSKDGSRLARLPRPNNHKDGKMADVEVPLRLDPQDIVKLLMALHKALKARTATA